MTLSTSPTLEDRTSDRHIRTPGTCNFRDLGGYPTVDGRRLRRGMVYRSGVLDRLDGTDAQLASLGIRVVMDLRTTREQQARPSALPPAWGATLWSRSYEISAGDHSRPPGERRVEDMFEAMLRGYRRMPFEQAEAYAELFRRLAEGQVPLLFHCHGGKDRTGIGAALLLDMLGVPRDLVRADYTLTEYCLARDEAVIEDGRAPKSDPIRAPLMRADAAYIDAMFERLEGQFGTTHAYLDEALGVDAAMRAQIADRLLEPA